MYQIALDFAPGLHGNFLELVLNKYVYGIPFYSDKIFQSSGAAHAINVDQNYLNQKIVNKGHFSSFGYNFDQQTQKVIFIDHAPKLDVVLLTNIFYRCHNDAVNVDDFETNEIISAHTSLMTTGNTDLDRRNDWFTKLSERHFEHASARPNTQLPVYNFDYTSFFDITDFCTELQKTAHFLNKTFKYDHSFGTLWQEFININQGWTLYKQAGLILRSMLTDYDMPIPDDWKLHAYLNFRLSKMFNLFDGVLYNNREYPKNTYQLMSVVKEHLDTFDSRFR